MKLKWISTFFLMIICVGAYAELAPVPVLQEHITKWKGKPYDGPTKVSMTTDEGIIQVKIETKDLILQSVTLNQIPDYLQLFGDPQTIEKYADTMPWTMERVGAAMMEWTQRWQVNQDPFSAFAIFSKKKERPFMGHIVLGHGSRRGQAELAFVFRPQYHDASFATQAVTAILYGYIPKIRNHYLVNMNNPSLEPSALRSIHATAHFDDTFSGQAMIRSGMRIGTEEVLWGALRFHYLISIDEIMDDVDDQN